MRAERDQMLLSRIVYSFRTRAFGRTRSAFGLLAWLALVSLAPAAGCAEEIMAPGAAGDPCDEDSDCGPASCGSLRACIRGRCQLLSQTGDEILRACSDGGVLVMPDAGLDGAGTDAASSR